jgi:hypothetical protein
MKRTIRFDRLLVAAAVVVAVFAVAEAAQAGPQEPEVPATITVPDGHKLFLVSGAVGVQIHACNPNGAGYRWDFVAPRATLHDASGKVVMTHFGGPTWQAKDGSEVVGSLDEKVTVDPTAIPWLRLKAASTAAGGDGDRLAGTTYIQRLETTGGLAPAAALCNAETVGDTAEVTYTAVYAFWKETGS